MPAVCASLRLSGQGPEGAGLPVRQANDGKPPPGAPVKALKRLAWGLHHQFSVIA